MKTNFYNSRPYIIFAPSYNPKSGGIIVQHKLCHMLNEFGANAFLYHDKIDGIGHYRTNHDYSTPIADKSIFDIDPIVIYAEIVSGNPLGAKNVIRWLLNRPGEIGGDGIFNDTDLIYQISTIHFTKDTSPDSKMLKVHERNLNLFKDLNKRRSGSCFLVHKGNRKNIDYELHPDAYEIKDTTPSEDLAKLFNEKEFFYCYDSATYMPQMAALCGITSVIMPDGSRTREELMRWLPYGVAYDIDDISRAKSTLSLFRPWVEEKESEEKESVKQFIDFTQQHFKPLNTCNVKSQSKDKVSIIILSYNTKKYTRKTIESIISSTNHPYEIIVVDNASKDGSVEYLDFISKKYANIKIIKNKENTGFSGGNNQGVKHASGEYVMIFNSDVIVFEGWLTSLFQALNSHEKIGAVGALSNSISGRQKIEVPYNNEDEYIEFAQKVHKKNKGKTLPRRRLAGFAILMEKKLYQDIDGFDESYQIGNFEDDDLSMKIRERGYVLMVDESVVIHHYGSQSFKLNNIDYSLTMNKNQKIFQKKWPNVNYNKLLEIEDRLDDWERQNIEMAFADFNTGNIEKSKSIIKEVLDINPISIEGLYLNSLLYSHDEKYFDAIECIDTISALGHKDSSIYNQKGIILINLKKFKDAVDCFQRAIDLDPVNIDSYKLRSEVLLILEEHTLVEDSLIETLNIFPDDIASMERLADIKIGLGDNTNGLIWINSILSIDKNNSYANNALKAINE